MGELEEFEEFVSNFTSKMDKILNGDAVLEEEDTIDKRTDQLVVEKVNILRNMANSAFAMGDYEEAIILYNEAVQISIDPSTLAQDGRPSDGWNSFINLKPIQVDPRLYVNSAVAKAKLKDYFGVIADCNSALSLSPGNIKALYWQAVSNRALGKFETALEGFTNCLKILESSKDSPKLVSPSDLRSKIEDLSLIVKDEQFLLAADGNLRESHGFQLIHELLDSFVKASQDNNYFKLFEAGNALISCLNQGSKMKISFRLHDGFFLLTSQSIHPSAIVTKILVSACIDMKENCRILKEREDFLFSLLTNANTDREIYSPLLELIIKESVFCSLWLKASPSIGKKVMLLYSNARDTKLKTDIARWLSENFKNVYKWDISYDFLLEVAMQLLESFQYRHSLDLLLRLVLSEVPAAKAAVKSNQSRVISILITLSKSEPSIIVDCLSIIYNSIVKFGAAHMSDTLSFQLGDLLCENQNFQVSIKILCKLTAPATAMYLSSKINWTFIEKLGSIEDPEAVADWIGLLSIYLNADSGLFRRQASLMYSLNELLQRCLQQADKFSRAVGNASLCLASFAKNESFLKELDRLDCVTNVIKHLRLTKSKAVGKNLSVLCAKLCKTDKGLQTVRSLQAFQLMAQYGKQ